MTDYGSNFDTIGQKQAFTDPIHNMIADLHSKSEKDFKTFSEYDQWVHSIYQKYASAFNYKARRSYLQMRA